MHVLFLCVFACVCVCLSIYDHLCMCHLLPCPKLGVFCPSGPVGLVVTETLWDGATFAAEFETLNTLRVGFRGPANPSAGD